MPRGPIALCCVVGLVLLSLLVAGPSYADGQATAHPLSAGHEWTPDKGGDRMPSLPPQVSSGREHLTLTLWPPPRGGRHLQAAHLALLPAPGPDAAAIRDPQQVGHRTAGSRSPPLI
ncbi:MULTISPECIES: hypothetical protein [unclassified Nonomuraea]|uniref:hypothetical protein n=1 Tax=unclassified Nonomuraea TaxID=2593643 RepID=UPI0033F48F7F